MKVIYIGIDFSLKSPAICMYKDGQYKWLSHCSKVQKPKKDVQTQEDIALLPDVEMEYQSGLLEGRDYSTNHWADLQNFRKNAREMVKMIFDEIGHVQGEKGIIHIGFEGYSFNSFSSSNNIYEIVAATTTFKNLLIDWLHSLNWEYSIDILAPANLKKFAGYSKWDKVDLFDVFTGNYDYIREKWADAIEKDHDKKVAKGKASVFEWDFDHKDLRGPFYNWCCQYEINRAVKKPSVPKPADDMIDAYFVCCWLRSKFSAA